MKKTFWIVLAIGGASVLFTDLSSDSNFYAVVLPLVTIACMILLLVTGFGYLYQKEYGQDYETHVSFDTRETHLPEDGIPHDARVLDRKIQSSQTVTSTRTVKFVDGKKIEDSYEQKHS